MDVMKSRRNNMEITQNSKLIRRTVEEDTTWRHSSQDCQATEALSNLIHKHKHPSTFMENTKTEFKKYVNVSMVLHTKHQLCKTTLH